MSAAIPEYREKSASAQEIQAHLGACSRNHKPPLDTRVDLAEYALKISRHAVTFEAWANGSLVGLVAAYLNDAAGRTGYITNVSVTPEFLGRGVASKLMDMCLERAAAIGMAVLVLEVGRANAAAIELYRKLGFEESGDNGDFITMKLSLAGD
jgi:ribosomal protein S18 acetylase RimI-like enzyme